MVSRESDERPSSPEPRRKARTRPPDVTEARSSVQRAKLDAQANARASKTPHAQAGQQSAQVGGAEWGVRAGGCKKRIRGWCRRSR